MTVTKNEFGQNNMFAKEPQIIIEENVLIGPYSVIHSGNHRFSNKNLPIVEQGFVFSEILIEKNVWIAAHCVILAGVKVCSGSIVGAGAVVTKNTQTNSVSGGVPAKRIK